MAGGSFVRIGKSYRASVKSHRALLRRKRCERKEARAFPAPGIFPEQRLNPRVGAQALSAERARQDAVLDAESSWSPVSRRAARFDPRERDDKSLKIVNVDAIDGARRDPPIVPKGERG